MEFSLLPDDPLLHILSYLQFPDLTRFVAFAATKLIAYVLRTVWPVCRESWSDSLFVHFTLWGVVGQGWGYTCWCMDPAGASGFLGCHETPHGLHWPQI